MQLSRFVVFIGALISTAANAQTSASTLEASSPEQFAICDVRQVITKETLVKVPAQASGGCDTGGGGEKSCQVNVGATASNYILDRGDTRNACFKLPDGGDNPCAFVRYGPVVFSSNTAASQTMSTDSGRVSVQLIVGQFQVNTVADESVIQSNLRLVVGRQFVIKRTKASNSTVSLECKKPNGEQFINLIPGADHSGGKIKQVSVENGGAFDLYVLQVVK